MAIQPDNYMTIQGFMRTELDLKGNELMVYALIYGFSLTDEGWFTGSRQYLADWLGCSIRTVQYALDSLTKKGLLEKRKSKKGGAVLYCDYRINSAKIALEKVKNLHYHECKNCTQKSAKIAHHNIEHIYRNKYIEHKDISPEEITEGLFEYD